MSNIIIPDTIVEEIELTVKTNSCAAFTPRLPKSIRLFPSPFDDDRSQCVIQYTKLRRRLFSKWSGSRRSIIARAHSSGRSQRHFAILCCRRRGGALRPCLARGSNCYVGMYIYVEWCVIAFHDISPIFPDPIDPTGLQL